MRSRIPLLTSIVSTGCLLYCAACLGAPMGTAITYQGRFTSGGSPANGAYDFEFRLFDAATGGTQTGSPVAKEDLSVADGYFTTTLDFGSGVFTGDARWLQIAVRPGAETGAYTTITPRLELTPTPYTLYSSTQGTVNYIPKFTTGGMANSAMFESGGNVGIGTANPTYRLEVSGTGRFASTLTTAGIYNYGAWYSSSAGSGDIWIPYANGNTYLRSPATVITHTLCAESGNWSIPNSGAAYFSQGNVGIGTTSPTQLLDVSGTVRCVNLIQTSDEQLKADVQPLSSVLDKLGQIRAVSFRWNEKAQLLGANTSVRHIGVLAQELERVFPELVATPEPVTPDELLKKYPEELRTPELRQRLQEDAEKTHYKAVNYSELTVVLLEAVQELQAQNRSLEQRIQALESKTK
jgi:hypothetical protein